MKRRHMILWMMILSMLCGMAAAGSTEIVIPEINIPSKEIPDSEAIRMIQEMKAGWNLGNTFDAYDCTWLSNPLDYESGWVGVKTSEKLIQTICDAGIRTLRVPVSWHNHLDETWKIDEAWLSRVEEVISWAYDRGMYVIVNIHHDCDPAYYYPDAAHYENSAEYVRRIWTQLAERFEPFDEHLIFECINEPRLKDTEYEWWWDANSAICLEAMEQIVKLNQVFVDTVRATGGNNADRYLMVPAYDANPDYACVDAFALPADTAEQRMIVSAHAYTPYDFALQQGGISTFDLENSTQKATISTFINRLYDKYVSKGIPVLIGEFGAMEKSDNLQDRVNWMAFYVAKARSCGISCCWWDNHCFEGEGERFGLFDRVNTTCRYPELLSAFMMYSE